MLDKPKTTVVVKIGKIILSKIVQLKVSVTYLTKIETLGR